jgi:hypothetical protein
MRTSRVFAMLLAAALPLSACAAEDADDLDDGLLPEDGKTDDSAPSVSDDSLNGIWKVTLDGVEGGEAVIESWPDVGIRLTMDGTAYQLTRSTDTLTGTDASLTVVPNDYTVYDDEIEGTLAGKPISLARDTSYKSSITVKLPGDRTYYSFLRDTLAPQAQRDRESYAQMRYSSVRSWLKSCELYKSGSWQRKYMKGSSWSEQSASFDKIISAVDYLKTTPRTLTRSSRFNKAVTANLKDPSLAGLAISTFSMYFSTAAGRALRIPIGTDSTIYFITDRPSRSSRIGLVVMKTPTHGPLASTFGRQLLDLGAMAATDDPIYARTMMEMMLRSSADRATQLSGVARSALTDWFSVMAIEDYRGVAFGNPSLSWGSNMTHVQFYGLVAKALARPGQTDSTGKPVIGQVIVGNELRPGEASYADVLNGGNDMQEYGDMGRLKQLATQFLRQKHPAEVAAVEAAFVHALPTSELFADDASDLFRYITRNLYDARINNLTPAERDTAINAVVALVGVLTSDSAAFESYILSTGVTKSNVAAPKSTGF